jgi:D-serine deaminase-like pyridoxal phosphate-dependent protein
MTSTAASTLATIVTPGLVLDQSRLRRNLARMAARLGARGVPLRPHLKTAKCLPIARMAAPNDDSPITVSTLAEAEYFAGDGYRDIFYAAGLGPGKFARAAGLHRAGVALVTMVDAPRTAELLARAALAAGVRFRTVIEIDCGEHRGGMLPDSGELIATARALGPNFAGVATHGGQSYGARSEAETAAVAESEAQAVRTAANRLTAAGWACEIASLGSSPTALAAADLTGVTEVRAGVYMFWDLFQAGIGACQLDDLALSVVAEVIGRPADRNEFLIDAGAFALSKDLSTAALPPERQAGFGWVCDLDGRLLPGLVVRRVWQEHGLVAATDPLPPGSFPVGSRVRILPNHACPMAAAYSHYNVIDGGPEVVATWSRINGW